MGTYRAIQNLSANQRMLMTVYNFLEVNGDGTINKGKFKVGGTVEHGCFERFAQSTLFPFRWNETCQMSNEPPHHW